MALKWAYGVTTIPSREKTLLPNTLQSLAAAGFDKPRLFFDGVPEDDWSSYDLTVRNPRIRTWGNWWLGLWELFIRDYNVDRYAMFQDDIVAVKGLRKYLENWYPKGTEQGYLNLYTVPENQKLAPKRILTAKDRWFKSNQRGLGALGLVFTRDALFTLFSSNHAVQRPATANDRRYRAIDGGIVDSFRKAGWKEYCHNPTLIQHTGHEDSSMGNNSPKPPRTFPGEDFDASLFLSENYDQPEKPINPNRINPSAVAKRKRVSKRIGLIGYCCATGLGTFNRHTAKFAEIDRWLVHPHRSMPMLEPPNTVDVEICPSGSDKKVDGFLNTIDTLLFFETPLYKGIVDKAKNRGLRVVCVPMVEWLPDKKREWTSKVDLFICPTMHSYQICKDDGLPCTYFEWPIDVASFPFEQRTQCNRFLFLNGLGGWRGRKGGDVIKSCLAEWPDMPITIKTQVDYQGWKKHSTGPNVRIVNISGKQGNDGLYSGGDVLLMPHKVDGFGLGTIEAISSGMPVIATDGEPWNEFPSIARIPASVKTQRIKRSMNWYLCNPASLVSLCKAILGKDISANSSNGRKWAEQRSWSSVDPIYDATRSDMFTHLVRTGAPK